MSKHVIVKLHGWRDGDVLAETVMKLGFVDR